MILNSTPAADPNISAMSEHICQTASQMSQIVCLVIALLPNDQCWYVDWMSNRATEPVATEPDTVAHGRKRL